MERDKRALMVAEQQMDIIINISNKIPDYLQTEFRKISELNDSLIEIYTSKGKKHISNMLYKC
jgi:hypothetical protein